MQSIPVSSVLSHKETKTQIYRHRQMLFFPRKKIGQDKGNSTQQHIPDL